MTLIDKIIGYFSPERAFRRQAYRRALSAMGSGYAAAGPAGRLRAWRFDARTEGTPSSADLARLRRRSNEVFRNYGVAAGIADTYADSVIGGIGLSPQSRIRADELGISEDEAERLRRQAELAWGMFSQKACVTGQSSFAELQHLALRRIIIDGEIFALPAWMGRDRWRPIKRAVQLIDAERVHGDRDGFVNGVKRDDFGRVTHYSIEPGNGDGSRGRRPDPVPYRAFDRYGRPRVLHVYFKIHPSQYRGIPLFAPVINMFHDIADYLEAELVAARVAACLAVFITRQDPYAYGVEASEADSTGEENITLKTGSVMRLKPGESINVVDPKRPGDSFDDFVTHVLRMIGASLGLPYELVLKDFSKTNYSSARSALIEARRRFTTWRAFFAQKFCQPFYDLVLEEAYLRGMFDAKDFYERRHLYCRASWIGPGWGWVDPVKEVRAAVESVNNNLSTLADEAASLGRDWEDVIAQRARERAAVREAFGISDDGEDDGT